MIRTSHIIFLMICVGLVSIFMFNANSLGIIDEIGFSEALGQSIGSLIIPILGYGGYLLLTRKKKVKTSSI